VRCISDAIREKSACVVCRMVTGGAPILSRAVCELGLRLRLELTLEPQEFLQTHLSLEPPEQPLTSDVKVDSLRPKLKLKVLSPSPPLSSPLPLQFTDKWSQDMGENDNVTEFKSMNNVSIYSVGEASLSKNSASNQVSSELPGRAAVGGPGVGCLAAFVGIAARGLAVAAAWRRPVGACAGTW